MISTYGSWSEDCQIIDIKPAQDGLVAYYPFEGNAFDVIGENTGVENIVEYFSSSYTVPNQVIAFNGVNSFVDLQNDFDYETMTINLWFNALKFENVFGIIYTSDNPQLNFGLTNIVIRNDDNINHLYINVSGQNEIVEIEENSWYNITMIRDKKSYRYCLNGALTGSGEFTEYYTSNNGHATAILG